MKELNLPRHRPRYRLSPNEVEHLKREETERRRKLRIIQVCLASILVFVM